VLALPAGIRSQKASGHPFGADPAAFGCQKATEHWVPGESRSLGSWSCPPVHPTLLRAAPTPGFDNKRLGKGQRGLAGGRWDAGRRGGRQVGSEGGRGAGMRGMLRGASAPELRGAGGVWLPAEPRGVPALSCPSPRLLLKTNTARRTGLATATGKPGLMDTGYKTVFPEGRKHPFVICPLTFQVYFTSPAFSDLGRDI